MNVSDKNPWDSYWNKGGFLGKRHEDPMMKGGFRNPGVPEGVPTVADATIDLDRRMQAFKRRPTPQRPQGFDLAGQMSQMGGPPQRPNLPDRPGPDRSAGTIFSNILAGASDVMGAAAGQRTNNLERLQGLQRQERDLRYGDTLRQQDRKFEGDLSKWQHGMNILGAKSSISDREQRGFEADRAFQMGEDDAAALDVQRQIANLRDQRRETTEDSRYKDTQGRLGRMETIQKELRDDARRMRDEYEVPYLKTRNAAAAAKEAHEAKIRPLEAAELERRINELKNKGLSPGMADTLLSGGEKAPAIDTLKENATKEKQRIIQAVNDGSMTRAEGESRIKAIDEGLQRGIGQHGFDASDAARMTGYNILRFLTGEGIADGLMDKPTEGIPGTLQRGFEGTTLGKKRAADPFFRLPPER